MHPLLGLLDRGLQYIYTVKYRSFWNGVTPVSYTHLDVYKRQILVSVDSATTASLAVISLLFALYSRVTMVE